MDLAVCRHKHFPLLPPRKEGPAMLNRHVVDEMWRRRKSTHITAAESPEEAGPRALTALQEGTTLG